MPTYGGHGEASLRLLVSSGSHDKLRGARRRRQAHVEWFHSDSEQDEAYARRQLHVHAQQREGGIYHGSRDRR